MAICDLPVGFTLYPIKFTYFVSSFYGNLFLKGMKNWFGLFWLISGQQNRPNTERALVRPPRAASLDKASTNLLVSSTYLTQLDYALMWAKKDVNQNKPLQFLSKKM